MSKKIKILIVRLSAIDEIVHCLPVVASLREKFPEATFGWVVEDKAAEILVNNPIVDKVFILPKKKWKEQGLNISTLKEICAFIKEIKDERFDIAIDLQEMFKSGIITFLSGAKRRIARAETREFADLFVNEKLKARDIIDPNKPVIERYLEAAEYFGADIQNVKFPLPIISQNTKDYVNGLLHWQDKNKPNAVFCPATTWSTKHWVEDYWTDLLIKVSEKCNVIFIGTDKDRFLIERITKDVNTEKYLSLAGKLNLVELIEVFNNSDIVVAPDTGPAHIAAATEKPIVVSIFGSTSQNRTKNRNKNISVSSKLPCQPCHKKKCSRKDNPILCMKEIRPDMVYDILEEKLTFIY